MGQYIELLNTEAETLSPDEEGYEESLLTVPSAPKARDEMTKAEFDVMMETGLTQAKNGESIPVEEAFDQLLRGI